MNIKLLRYLTSMACFLTAKAANLGGQNQHIYGCFDSILGEITVEDAQSIIPNSCIAYGPINKVPVDVIDYVLRNELVDVNICDRNRLNSITYALIRGDYEAANALVAHGADVNDCCGSTPMIEIIRLERLTDAEVMKAIKFLLHHDADPGKLGRRGDSALLAATTRNLELVKMFLDLGVNINHQNNTKMTPLHMTLSRCPFYNRDTLDKVKLLLDYGADLSIKDSSNETPLFTALDTHHFEEFEYIIMKLKRDGDINLLNEPNINGKTVINHFKYQMNGENLHRIVTEIITKCISLGELDELRKNLKTPER